MTALTTAMTVASVILITVAHAGLIALLISVLRERPYPWPVRVGLVIVFVAVLVLFDGTLLLRIWGPQ